MLLTAVSVLVVTQSSSEIPEGLMNNPVFNAHSSQITTRFSLSEGAKLCKYKYYMKKGTFAVNTQRCAPCNQLTQYNNNTHPRRIQVKRLKLGLCTV